MNITRFLKTVSGNQRSVAVSSSDPLPTTNAANGAVADAAYTDNTGAASGSAVSLLKGLYIKIYSIWSLLNTFIYVTPKMSSAGHGSVQTNATGTTYTALSSQACKQVTLVNNTGTTLEVRQGGSGVAVPVFDQSFYTFYGVANANELDVRRNDTSNTQVTAQYRWEA